MSIATLTIDIVGKLGSLEKDLAGLNGKIDSFSKSASSSLNVVKGALAALGVVISVDAFAGLVHSSIDTADAMGKAAQKAGMATKEFSALAYAARFSELDVEALGMSMKGLNTHLADAARGNTTAQQSFTALSLSINNQDGTLRTANQVLLDISEKFQKMPDGIEKSDLAVKLFGKSGLSMIPMLNAGKDGIQQLTAEAEKMGLVIDGKTAAAAERFNDNLTRAAAGVEGMKNQIGIGLLPVLNGLMDKFMEAGGGMDEFGNKTRGALDAANVRKWAEDALTGLAWVVDSAHGFQVVVESIGKTLGAGAAQALAISKLDFAGAAEIGRQWQADLEKSLDYTPMVDKTKKFFDELSRTVSVSGQTILLDSAAHAAEVQAIYDRAADESKAAVSGVTLKTTAELDAQYKIAQKYSEEAKKLSMGEQAYAISKIKERYQIELDAIKGMSNEKTIAAEIHKKMDIEIGAISSNLNSARIGANELLTDATAKASAERVAIEKSAAQAIASAQQPAYAAKIAVASAGAQTLGDVSLTVSQASDKFWTEFNSNFSSPGFATGGSFTVGGSGGTDTTPVRFMATPGERVTIQTPEQQRAGSGSITIQNLNLPGISNARQFVDELRQMLRSEPNLLTVGSRAG